MLAPQVHREPLYRRYYASPFSGACCYAISFGFILIFLPLIIAYNSSCKFYYFVCEKVNSFVVIFADFWLKEDIVYEQPQVNYRYQTIVQMHGSRFVFVTLSRFCWSYTLQLYLIRDGTPLNLFYSTSKQINELNGVHLRIPLFQSAELDDNRDGKTDRIEIAMQMPLAPTETVHGFTALVYCNSRLESKAKYIFDAVSYVNYESMSAMTQLNVDGDLVLRQTWPLTAKGG